MKPIARRVLTAFAILACMPCSIAVAALFQPDDRLVSDPNIDLIDPEFDPKDNLMVWQDRNGNLWLADIDQNNGAITPTSGKGLLVDTGLSNIIAIGNGPEFGYGAGGSAICYNKRVADTRFLAVAYKNVGGFWTPSLLGNGANRWRPMCTGPDTLDEAKVIYINQITPDQRALSWRILNSPDTERSFTTVGDVGGRWVPKQHAFVAPNNVGGFKQLFWVDIDTEQVSQITSDNSDKFAAIPWFAPEYNDILISAAVNFDSIGIFRRISGQWTIIHTIKIPTNFLYISSPEPFVHNGKSYIAVVATESLGSDPLPYFPAGPGEIWIANINPAKPFFRRIDRGEDGVFRSEPEPFMLNTGPVVYFTEHDPITGYAVVRVADTGLGSPTAGDSDSDGVSDDRDNCTQANNPNQVDADADGIGNRCDADLNNDCIINTTDIAIIISLLNTTNPNADLNNDGNVNNVDYLIAKSMLNSVPGPANAPHLCSMN